MFCTRCGTKNPDNSDYCFNCGEKMDAPGNQRPVGTSSGAAAKQSRSTIAMATIDVGGTPLIVSDKQIVLGRQVLNCDDVVGIRYGVYKHYTNGIRDSRSYAVWLTDGRNTMQIECAKMFARTSTVEASYQETLKALYRVIIVPLVQSFLTNLDNGNGFRVADVVFDKNGIHRTTSFGSVQRGLLSAWVSVAGGSSVEEREQRSQHLAWTDFGGHSFGDGNIHIFRNKEMWVQFPLRDTWNAVCLGPMFDFLYEEGRLWSFVNR